jgi:hypothetical protein
MWGREPVLRPEKVGGIAMRAEVGRTAAGNAVWLRHLGDETETRNARQLSRRKDAQSQAQVT